APRWALNRQGRAPRPRPAAAYAPVAAPATANEPVRCRTWTSRAMLNIASGSRATTEVASRVRAGRMVPVMTGARPETHRSLSFGPGRMDRFNGLDIPETLADALEPSALALVVYDMQVGIVGQIADGDRVL